MSRAQFQELSVNHIAFTVAPSLLDEAGRKRIMDFFAGCLDFTPDPASKHVMMVHKRPGLERWDYGATYILFIGKEDDPMSAKPGRGRDHIGISCTSLEQFNSYLERIQQYLAKYGITDNIDVDMARPELHSFYVKPLDAPVSIEIQFLEKA